MKVQKNQQNHLLVLLSSNVSLPQGGDVALASNPYTDVAASTLPLISLKCIRSWVMLSR